MKICSKCLNVYGSSSYIYCPLDGQMTFDAVSEEGKILTEKLKDKMKKEGKIK